MSRGEGLDRSLMSAADADNGRVSQDTRTLPNNCSPRVPESYPRRTMARTEVVQKFLKSRPTVAHIAVVAPMWAKTSWYLTNTGHPLANLGQVRLNLVNVLANLSLAKNMAQIVQNSPMLGRHSVPRAIARQLLDNFGATRDRWGLLSRTRGEHVFGHVRLFSLPRSASTGPPTSQDRSVACVCLRRSCEDSRACSCRV